MATSDADCANSSSSHSTGTACWTQPDMRSSRPKRGKQHLDLNAASSMPGSLYMAHGQCNLCHEVVNQGSSPPQTATDPSMGMARQWDTLHGAPGILGALTCSELPVRSKYQPLTGPILVTRLVLSSLAMLPVAGCTTPALRDIVTLWCALELPPAMAAEEGAKIGILGWRNGAASSQMFSPLCW